jgi:hypothetical protein
MLLGILQKHDLLEKWKYRSCGTIDEQQLDESKMLETYVCET